MGRFREALAYIDQYMQEYYEALGRGPHLDVPQDTFDETPKGAHIETENARYVQHLWTPFLPNISEDVITDADAIVLESGSIPYEDWTLEDMLGRSNPDTPDTVRDIIHQASSASSIPEQLSEYRTAKKQQEYQDIVKTNLEGDPAPIYLMDLPPRTHPLQTTATEVGLKKYAPYVAASHLFGIRRLATGLARGSKVTPGNPAVLLFGAPYFSGYLGHIPRWTEMGERPAQYAQVSKMYTATGLQSAATAEKLEEHVAPALAEELDEKPDILLMYDVKDMDIGAYLRHPRLRRFVLDSNARLSYCSMDTFYLDKVYEFQFDGDMPADEEDVTELLSDSESLPYTTEMHTVDSIQVRDCFSILPPWPNSIPTYDDESENELRYIEDTDPSYSDVPEEPEDFESNLEQD